MFNTNTFKRNCRKKKPNEVKPMNHQEIKFLNNLFFLIKCKSI